MTPEELLAQVEFFGSSNAVRAVAAVAGDQEAATIAAEEEAAALAKIREEIERQAADTATMRTGYEINQASLLAQLATVRTTGKTRVGDGINRREWTHAQWLGEARSIFNDAFGGAGDLLNGHVSALWKALATAEGQRDQLFRMVYRANRLIITALGADPGPEVSMSSGPDTPTEPGNPPSTLDTVARSYCYHCGSASKGNPKCPVCRPYDPEGDAKELPFRQIPAIEGPASYIGSDKGRQSVGDPGHCERCVSVGHVKAHPELGCGDVGCYQSHEY